MTSKNISLKTLVESIVKKEIKKQLNEFVDSQNKALLYFKNNKIKPYSDLNYSTDNGINYYIGDKNNIAYVKLPLKTSGLSQNEKMTIEVALPALDFKSSPTLSKTTMTNVEATSWKSEFIDYGGVMYKPLLKLMMDVDKVRNARKL